MKTMKKCAIAIIALALAALVFGCDIKTGGTLVVTNGFSTPMIIAAGKILPNMDSLDAVQAGDSKSFSFDDDGFYTIGYIPVDKSLDLKLKTEYLSGGDTKRITVGP